MPQLVDGRNCENCTLCCKLLSIEELGKPRQQWCPECNPKAGCNIYGDHPPSCQVFHCSYLLTPDLGEHWKPRRSKMVLHYEEHANRIVIHVDGTNPTAWRRKPYFDEIKQMSRAAASNRGQVVVWQGLDCVVVLPDTEENLGRVREDQLIVVGETQTEEGVQLRAFLMDRDDPRAANLV